MTSDNETQKKCFKGKSLFIKNNKLTKTALVILGFVFAAHLALRLYSIALVPPSTDEPDDIFTISNDLSKLPSFFHQAYAPDQSRLPFFVSAPFYYFLGGKNSVIPLRILFLGFYIAYLWVSYKLVFLVTKNARAALMYVTLLFFSCYLAGFSIFAISTAGWLYVLFHVLAIYFFWKSICYESEKGVFNGVVLLSVLIGLCTASKLFGVFLLPAFMTFHWIINKGKMISIQKGTIVKLLIVNLLFLLGLAVVNYAAVSPVLKLSLALFLSILYLAFLGYLLKREKSNLEGSKKNLLSLWFIISLTAFCVTIIFSPIYLNLSNIFLSLDWFGKWSTGFFVQKHGVFDIPIIMVIKYGLISSAALLAAIIAGLNKREAPTGKFGLLIGLVFLVHFSVISSVGFIVTWYPLAIFPFLYLPIVFFYDGSQKKSNSKLIKISLIIFYIILLDNVTRYYYWFPYAHFDGGQYGKRHVGWNKSAMVSFEWFPQVFSFFQSFTPSQTYTINVQICYVPTYNSWVVRLLKRELNVLGKDNILLVEEAPGENSRSNYIFSSPIYNPELEDKLGPLGYQRIKMISLKGIDMISIWSPKGSLVNG